ncbi:MAG: glycosyltransferase family 4 protein [Xenococcaceae cyanobacterium]
MKIAYVTEYDATNILEWSGTGAYIAKSLSDCDFNLEYVGSLATKYSLFFKSKLYFYRYILKKRYLLDREPIILKNYARLAAKQISEINPDLIFSPGTVPISYLESDRPIAFWTDANFAEMVNFYPVFSNLCQESFLNGQAMEKSVLERCKLAIYASDWAAQSAIEHYQINPDKVKVVPFGANLECDRNLDDITNLIKFRSRDRCKLLFLGVDWFRKGGDIAYQVTKQLNEAGLKTELTIVGCQPIIDEPLPNYIKSLGFISKNTSEGRKQLEQIIGETHFLILPSQAECYGIVFCEANSFGVPCISKKVGGIPTIIRDNINGKLFDKNAEIAEYCQYIETLFTNYSKYEQLALSSFQEYQSRLNWEVAGKTVRKLLIEIV